MKFDVDWPANLNFLVSFCRHNLFVKLNSVLGLPSIYKSGWLLLYHYTSVVLLKGFRRINELQCVWASASHRDPWRLGLAKYCFNLVKRHNNSAMLECVWTFWWCNVIVDSLCITLSSSSTLPHLYISIVLYFNWHPYYNKWHVSLTNNHQH